MPGPLSLATRFPLSLLLGGLIAVLMAATAVDAGLHGDLVARLSVAWPDIDAGRLWRLPSSSVVQEDTGVVWAIVALLPVVPAAEARFGTVRALAVWVACDAASSLLALGALEVAGDHRLAAEPNLGSSAGLLGLLAAWVTTLAAPHRRRALAALGLGLAEELAVDPGLAAAQHVIAVAVGVLLGSSAAHLRRPSSVP